jgi:hypothetical protein
MKKIVFFVAFLLGLSFVQAQSDFNIRFGLQLSPTFSWLSSDVNNINGNGVNLGLKLAMMGEYYFAENYAITSGLGFAFNHGGTLRYEGNRAFWKLDGTYQVADAKYSVQYIEIPLGLKMRTREYGYLRYFGEPNITIGFRSQATGDLRDTEFNDVEIKEFVSGAALSWGIGAGVEYGLSESTAAVGGIYFQNMFTDLTKDVDLGDDSKTTLKAIVLRLGILF